MKKYGMLLRRGAMNRAENKALFAEPIYTDNEVSATDEWSKTTVFAKLISSGLWGIMKGGAVGFDYARENTQTVFVYKTLKAAVLAYKLGVRGDSK